MIIYCVEDDDNVREMELYTLRSTGFDAEGFSDGNTFFQAVEQKRPDLILLDIMLPGEDGISILKKLKAKPETTDLPVIMATAKGLEYDKVQGLDLGADDYLVKPFGMMEMVSRIKAVLRRYPATKAHAVSFCGIILDPESHQVTVDNQTVVLTLKEFDLLSVLMAHPGKVFTRDNLLSSVWGMDYFGETRTVDMHIKTLRQKLGDYGLYIKTVRGVGYKMEDSKDE